MAQQAGYQTVPLSMARRMQLDGVTMATIPGAIHGLIEVDVTLARQMIGEHLARTGERLSFTAYAIACLARAVDENRAVQAYRDWRNRLVIFEEVDVNTMVEAETEAGEKVVTALSIRAANTKTLRQIHDEIRAFQRPDVGRTWIRYMRLFMAMPGPLRRLVYSTAGRSPRGHKMALGTVAMSSVGMFGGVAAGAVGGWGIPVAHHTLAITLGGTGRRPVLVDGCPQDREFLCVTISVDHAIVDGAPAARFAARFRELMESAHGLADV